MKYRELQQRNESYEEQNGNFKTERYNNQVQSSVDDLKGRMNGQDEGEKKISQLDNRAIEITQSKEQRKNELKKKKK